MAAAQRFHPNRGSISKLLPQSRNRAFAPGASNGPRDSSKSDPAQDKLFPVSGDGPPDSYANRTQAVRGWRMLCRPMLNRAIEPRAPLPTFEVRLIDPSRSLEG